MKYFQTSDKKLFYVEDLAKNHARSLEDKTVKKVDSADLKVEPKEQTPVKKTTGKEASKKENLETEVNQDKSKGSDLDATQKVDEVKKDETKTDK